MSGMLGLSGMSGLSGMLGLSVILGQQGMLGLAQSCGSSFNHQVYFDCQECKHGQEF
jgi:hypothetical protein